MKNKIFVVNNELKFRLKVNYNNAGAIRIGKNQGISLIFYTQPDNGSIYKVLTGPKAMMLIGWMKKIRIMTKVISN